MNKRAEIPLSIMLFVVFGMFVVFVAGIAALFLLAHADQKETCENSGLKYSPSSGGKCYDNHNNFYNLEAVSPTGWKLTNDWIINKNPSTEASR